MWDRRVVEKIEVYVGEYVVACSFKNVADDFSWAFAGVYGPHIISSRRLLWEELAGLMSWWICLGALGVISMSLIFRMKDQGSSFLPSNDGVLGLCF
jgi:hypothetical protein